VDLGSGTLLYKADAIWAIHSPMNGLKWLGCLGLNGHIIFLLCLTFFLFFFSLQYEHN
jgi:hypothetical protein